MYTVLLIVSEASSWTSGNKPTVYQGFISDMSPVPFPPFRLFSRKRRFLEEMFLSIAEAGEA
ncbi:MAG: hypothetical protein WC813_04925 [Patescibacteria group bacterium]|jgi:hypothetical protein